jgi:hypothetical protein
MILVTDHYRVVIFDLNAAFIPSTQLQFIQWSEAKSHFDALTACLIGIVRW